MQPINQIADNIPVNIITKNMQTQTPNEYSHINSPCLTRKKNEKSDKGTCKISITHLVEEIFNLPLADVPREVPYINGAAATSAHCFLQSTMKISMSVSYMESFSGGKAQCDFGSFTKSLATICRYAEDSRVTQKKKVLHEYSFSLKLYTNFLKIQHYTSSMEIGRYKF